jgi:hypothetical protein
MQKELVHLWKKESRFLKENKFAPSPLGEGWGEGVNDWRFLISENNELISIFVASNNIASTKLKS